MKIRFCNILLLVLGSLFALPAFAQVDARAQEFNGSPSRSSRAQTTGRIIVKWRKEARTASTAARAQKASAAGFKLQASGAPGGDLEALVAERRLSTTELTDAVAQLERDADIELAAIEYRRKPHALTNDPLLMDQWYLLSTEASATRTDAAWDVTQRSAAIVVAVIDTGVRFDHPDLRGKVLTSYDFVSNSIVANDGDGRDSDAADPGDWVTVAADGASALRPSRTAAAVVVVVVVSNSGESCC